jgi:membrane protease YdiL (CAAX protease family)
VISALMSGQPLGHVGDFVASNVDFMLLILGTWMLHVFLHRRPWRTLITTRQSISWRRIFQGAAVWGVIMLCSVVIQSVLFPERYVWTFDAQRWLLFFILALLLTPIQCAAEEVFFRGYLLQAFGRISRHPLVAASLSSVMFTLPHLANPEVTANGMWIMVVTYFAMGLFFALVALRDARLELSIGAHTANNFFLMVFFGYKDSPLPASAMFTTQAYDPVFSLVSVVVSSWVFYAWFFRRT